MWEVASVPGYRYAFQRERETKNVYGTISEEDRQISEAITGSAATPASEHLFKVRDEEDRKIIDEERAQDFHYAVAQLLSVTLRCRRDLQMAVAFLSTRVKDPGEDDWGGAKKAVEVFERYVIPAVNTEDRQSQ